MLERMEDIVAVEVGLDTGESRFFLTWGRIQDPVGLEKLAAVVLKNAPRFAIGDGAPVSARVRWSLQPATEAPYFYEVFFQMCQQPIPFGAGYEAWRKRMLRRMREGKEIHYLGHYAVDEPLDGWDAGESSGDDTRRREFSNRSGQ